MIQAETSSFSRLRIGGLTAIANRRLSEGWDTNCGLRTKCCGLRIKCWEVRAKTCRRLVGIFCHSGR